MPTSCGIEVDVPAVRVVEARREPPYVGRAVTTLVVEPDASRSRRMVHILSGRRYRVVPVSSAEEAIDLVQRLRFDIVFSSTGQLLERVREYVRAFVLVGDSAGTEAAFASTNGGAFVLRNPDDAAEMEQLVEEVKKYLAHQRSLNSQTLRD
jgi:DNA-binding NtrC family response regulator